MHTMNKSVFWCVVLCSTASVACGSSSGGEPEAQGATQAISGYVASSYNCDWDSPGAYFDGTRAGSIETSADGQSIRIDGYGEWVPRTAASGGTVTFSTPNLWSGYGRSTIVLDEGLLNGADTGKESWNLPSAYDGVHDYWMNFKCHK